MIRVLFEWWFDQDQIDGLRLLEAHPSPDDNHRYFVEKVGENQGIMAHHIEMDLAPLGGLFILALPCPDTITAILRERPAPGAFDGTLEQWAESLGREISWVPSSGVPA